MSINRNLATFAKDVQTDGSLKGIAVTVTVAGGKFVIDGTSQQTMFIPKGVKYRFDVSDSSVSGHPLVFSETSDGTHGGGSAYTTGITTSGTAGSSGAYVEVQLQQDAPDLLYYYCSNHSGMGAGAETAPQAVTTYTDSDVDTHLNTSGASSGQLLGWNGSDYAWVADSDTSGIDNLSEDTTPQLGGSLDVNGQSIVSASNGNIAITPNGSGKVIIDGLSHPTADGSANQVLKTDGSGNLSFVDQSSGGIASVAADTTPQLGGDLDINGQSIISASNGNIAITPNGSGKIILDGLSFPTADGSADQVLKTDGSGNLSFVAQSTGGGGGTLTATASGSLSDGSTVAINADGTVSVIAVARTQNIGAKGLFDDTQYSGDNSCAVYYADQQKIVVLAKDRLNNTYYLAGYVGTVSGETISFGSKQILHSSRVENIAVIYDPDTDKIVCSYADWTAQTGNTRIITLAANGTLTAGSEVEHFSGGYMYFTALDYDTVNNKVLMVYRGASSKEFVRVGTVSGTSISWGSAVQPVNVSVGSLDIAYNPTVQRVVVMYRDDSGPTTVKAVVGTVSGTSTTWGSPTSIIAGQDSGIFYDPSSTKMLAMCQDQSASPSTDRLAAFVGTIASSGNSISFGSTVHPATYEGSAGKAVYDPTSNKMVVLFQKDESPYNMKLAFATISGTSVTFTTPVDFVGSYQATNGRSPLAYDSGNDRFVFAFGDADSDNSYDGEAVVIRTATAGGATLTAENFVGISNAAYASGATATIQTAGSVDDAQSGLTAGQTYYVQAATGDLSTTPDTISVVAGTAISATKLLINPDSDPTVTTYTDADVNTHLNVSGASSGQILSWNGSDYAWTADSGGLNVVSSHSQTLSSNTTVAATDNAMSVGPLTVANGVTLTISSGARYVVV